MRKPPLVEVCWQDACKREGPIALANAGDDTLATRYTVGYLTVMDAKHVRLAMTFDPPAEAGEQAEVDDRMTIPRRWVKSIRYIERGEAARRVKYGRRN